MPRRTGSGGTIVVGCRVPSVAGMTFLMRFGVLCGVLCGVFIAVPGAVEAFTGETAPTSFVLALSTAFGVPLLTAIQLAQREAGGRLGEIGYAVNVVGLGLFGGAAYALNVALYFLDRPVLEDLLAGPTRFALLGSVAVFVIGVALFGVSMLRAGVLPRVPVWVYLVAFPVFAFASKLPDSPLTSALHVLVGGSLVWLALAVRALAAREPLDDMGQRSGAERRLVR